MDFTEELRKASEEVAGMMMDLCQLGRQGEASGPEPTAAVSYDTEPIACGVSENPGDEVSDGSQAPLIGIVIRLPLTASLKDLSRIRVTTRLWEDLSKPEIYAVLGVPVRGFTCYMARCERITGESVK